MDTPLQQHNAATSLKPVLAVERITAKLSAADLNDLCDATDSAIHAGGGFGWTKIPPRAALQRFWEGVVAMPIRALFVARLDGVICGAAQLVRPPKNNEAQSFAVNLTNLFIAPWARGHGLSRMLLDYVEKEAFKEGYEIINLDVRETQTTAIQLYESAHYQLIGTHPEYAKIDGKVIAGRYYYKKL
ncbi:MAG: GNAT family N-acetyltransferase [Alphaproteobacteria bacterium]|nr:GNAT family N-acetyltransferase [Alphaproteobacteria bacterium]